MFMYVCYAQYKCTLKMMCIFSHFECSEIVEDHSKTMKMVMGSLQKNILGGSQQNHEMVKGSLQDECIQRITTVPSIGNGISLIIK